MGKRKAKKPPSGSQQTIVATLEWEPVNLSEVIRAVLVALQNPNAKAAEVKRVALTMFPSWRERIEGEKNWSNYVTQNRNKAAEEMDVDRRSQAGRPPKGTLAFRDYEAAADFIDRWCDGDTEKALGLLEFLAGQNFGRLRKSVKAWNDLVESVGSPEAATKALEVMRQAGGVISR